MKARELAEKTKDAYSADAFGEAEWKKAAKMLLKRGYSPAQAEGILRSKWTRWCRDAYSDAGEGKAKYLEQFLDEPKNNCTLEHVESLCNG